MSLSFLVRIIPELLREGRVAGQAEVVETGQSVVFRNADEVIRFIRHVGQGVPPRAGDGVPVLAQDRTLSAGSEPSRPEE